MHWFHYQSISTSLLANVQARLVLGEKVLVPYNATCGKTEEDINILCCPPYKKNEKFRENPVMVFDIAYKSSQLKR